MQRALAFALALTASKDENALNNWLLATLNENWHPQGILLALPDASGRQLDCYSVVKGHAGHLMLETRDFSHPLANILQTNRVHIWDSLNGGASIENAEFLAFLQQVGTRNGLYALPILDRRSKNLGVLGVFDDASMLRRWQQTEELGDLVEIYARQLGRFRSLRQHQNERSALKNSLRNVNGESQQHNDRSTLLASKLIGQSDLMLRLREHITQMARHDLSVLILGETGTGKDVVARLIHQCSARAHKPFVAINCAAIPENLIESELFGYLKGAFSGAQKNNEGLLAQANGGTLFLDEIGDMPLMMQAKMLRVLETHHYRPLGADKERHSDFRVIAATHQPLQQNITEGRFREDLWHRLCQGKVVLPPLRERAEDIPALCHHFVTHFAQREGKHYGLPGRLLLSKLMQYSFPGNIRELRNMLEVACAHTADGDEISLSSLTDDMLKRLNSDKSDSDDAFQHIHDLREAIQQYETTVIAARLRFFDGNRYLVAESLNIPRRTLDHKCQKLEVK